MSEAGSQRLVEVAVFAPLAGSFTYCWPAHLGEPIAGIRVETPFGRGRRIGVVVGQQQHQPEYALKTVWDRLDAVPLIDNERRNWLERARRYYLAGPGEIWSTALGWAAQSDLGRYRCAEPAAVSEQFSDLAPCFHTRAAVSLKRILKRGDHACGLRWQIERACEAGVVQRADSDFSWQEADAGPTLPHTLNPMQQQALESILMHCDTFAPFLLFGCTGSGKTEVYLRAAAQVIESGGQVLVLVPEIGLTPLWLNRLRSRFKRVAVWHSAMRDRERLDVAGHLGDIDILIGTRSALFLPLPRLKMIVVDEEHDASFKQQEGLAYHARDLAVMLAQQFEIPIVLGSATPSLESWRQAHLGHYRRLDLPERVSSAAGSVDSEVIDMRGVDTPISDALVSELKQNLDRGEQSILFLNRRGYAPALQCTACGYVPECPECSLRLTLHRRAGALRCHSCGFRRRTPKACEVCGEAAFLPLGEGTEQIDEWLTDHLPDLRFARFDRDMVTSHARLEQTLSDFERGDVDCLIGTQMLVKGHDFPNVTLVGVVNADLGAHLPDFRASERWWQQMTQVTGRAGRGQKPGRVIIQTRMPDAPWLLRIDEADAEATLNQELELRQMLSFPPFARWVRIVFSARRLDRAHAVANTVAAHCSKLTDIAVTGPMPCALERLAGRFRIEIVLRDSTRTLLPWQLEPIVRALKLPSDVRIRIDVDPQEMM